MVKKKEEIVEDIEVKKKNDDNNKFIKIIKEFIPYVVIFIVVVLVRTYLFTPIIVSGPSMQPTLDGGEMMILNKNGSLDRFDVVVVDITSEDIIKRIIAMPGETISCENGVIFVNGRRQDEEYSKGITRDFDKIQLKDNEYFVMGDNRENSKDSRDIGPVTIDMIKGTTKLVLFPFSKIGNIE